MGASSAVLDPRYMHQASLHLAFITLHRLLFCLPFFTRGNCYSPFVNRLPVCSTGRLLHFVSVALQSCSMCHFYHLTRVPAGLVSHATPLPCPRHQPGGLWQHVVTAVTRVADPAATSLIPPSSTWLDDVRTPTINIGDGRIVQNHSTTSSTNSSCTTEPAQPSPSLSS